MIFKAQSINYIPIKFTSFYSILICLIALNLITQNFKNTQLKRESEQRCGLAYTKAVLMKQHRTVIVQTYHKSEGAMIVKSCRKNKKIMDVAPLHKNEYQYETSHISNTTMHYIDHKIFQSKQNKAKTCT